MWILIWIAIGLSSTKIPEPSSTASAEFASKAACDTASKRIMDVVNVPGSSIKVLAFCFPKQKE
jgi:hypothetical protein